MPALPQPNDVCAGLVAVDAACQEALDHRVCSASVIFKILARSRDPAPSVIRSLSLGAQKLLGSAVCNQDPLIGLLNRRTLDKVKIDRQAPPQAHHEISVKHDEINNALIGSNME